MNRTHSVYMNAIGRIVTLLLCAVMAVSLVPGLSGKVYAAEVKGPRLLIQVQGEKGYRVPGLEIYYLPPDTPSGVESKLLGKTDARGELVFTDLEKGEFQFFYSVPGEKGKMKIPYTIKDTNGRPTLTINDPRLKGDAKAAQVENAPLKLDIVGFQVVDAQGTPLPNAKLAFQKCPSSGCTDSKASGHTRVFTTITDREGNCAYSGLQTGSYHVEATVYDNYHRELFSETVVLNVAAEDNKQTRTIPLSKVKPAETAKPGNSVLTLAFTDKDGKPVTDVRVGYREPVKTEDYWLGCTDGKGEICLAGLKKGTYTFFHYSEQDNNKKDNRTDFTYEVKDPAVAETVPVKVARYVGSEYATPLHKGDRPEIDTGFDWPWISPQTGIAEPIYDEIVPKTTITILDQNEKPVAGAKCVITSRCWSKNNNNKGEQSNPADLQYTSEVYADNEGKAVFTNFHTGSWEIRVYRKDEFQRYILVGRTSGYFVSEIDTKKEVKYTVYADEVENGIKE